MKLLFLGSGKSTEIRCRSSDKNYCDAEIVTLDINPDLKTDVVHDLNNLPYPFENEEFDEIHAYEVLEHFGRQGDYEGFFKQFNELHRILKPSGKLIASVPRHDSIWAWGDPGHTRVINEGTLVFLDKTNPCKPPMTDYRSLIRGNGFVVEHLQASKDQLWFVLEKR